MFSEDLDVMCEDCGNRDKCEECTKVSRKPQKDYWANVCEINRRQTEKGIRTYGQRLEDNTVPGIIDRINYFEEELVDALKYAEWMKDYLSAEKIIEVLNKQIPKKPESQHHCPRCGSGLDIPELTLPEARKYINFYPKFCQDCGQAIDWSK